MSDMSDKTALAVLDHVLGKAGDFGAAGNRYLRLWTTLPAADGTGGTEVSGGSYAAQEISGDFPDPSTGDRSEANDTAITFPTATADWGTVVGYTISTASTGTATFVLIDEWDNPIEVENGDDFEVAAGSLVVTVA